MNNPDQSNETDCIAPMNALVMAASRRGVDDPVARLQGKSHKCLVELDGQVMLERVVEALLESGCCPRVHVSIDSPDILRATPRMRDWHEEGRVIFVQSRGNLADSVLTAVNEIEDPLPLLITTGDNALHTRDIIRDFVRASHTSDKDVTLGMTSEEVVSRQFPDSGLAFHRLSDGGYSSCNLYALMTAEALKAVRIFESGGQFGKRHLRILKAFGIVPFLVYKFKLASLGGLLSLIGRRLKVSLEPVMLDYPWGPIDVDNRHSFELSEATLIKRRMDGKD